MGQESRTYAWPDAEAFIHTQFGRYSERMAAFAEHSFREGWIDAEPRPGKEGGAFCTSVRPGESRVLMNYDFSFNSVSTLAHELGHAYHNLNLAERTPLQCDTPSTLAETASIFCETLSLEAALAEAAGAERLALLEASLQRDLLVVVDIHSRFLFEKAVFERRAHRELTPRELDELMLSAQRETYGDGLDRDLLHSKMWAVKGHYYGPTFYNYPYTFGLLFGLGLYSHYTKDPERFRVGYDALLSSTGLADAATLAARFGIDIHGLSFWRSSLDVIRARVAEFESLV
jgi:oligoendopeptidase F